MKVWPIILALLVGASSVLAAPAPRAQGKLIAIAKTEAQRRGVRLENKRAPIVFDDGSNWVVVLDPAPAGWKGGGVEVTIDKLSGKATDLVRGK